MRRDQFVTLVETHRVNLVKLLLARKFDLAEASDVVHEVIARWFEKNSYLKVELGKDRAAAYSMLRTSVLNEATDRRKRQHREAALFSVTGVDEDNPDAIAPFLVTVPVQQESVECPFCFQGPLNQYGACQLCGTILGTDRTIRRVALKINEVGYDPDLAQAIDVRNAISLLSDYEQLVVSQIIDGNETFTTLSDVSEHTRKSLYRTWISAKAKLQKILSVYDTRPKACTKAA